MSEAPRAFITGGSRGIGAETAKALATRGWDVAIGYNDKARRADGVVKELTELGSNAVAIQGDITEIGDRIKIEDELRDWSTEIDAVVLNAAGGLERDKSPGYARLVNVDSQVELAKNLSSLMRESGNIVYVTSHWAHLHRQVQLPPFSYYPVASSKHAGEEALKAAIPQISDREIHLVIVTGGLVTGTFVGDMGERRFERFTEEQRAIGNVVDVETMGEAVAEAASRSVEDNHVVAVGADLETFKAANPIIFEHNTDLPEVKTVIPHREPALWLDGVMAAEPGQYAIGYWKPGQERYAGHFEDAPVLQGVQQLESVAQLGGYLAMMENPGEQGVLFGSAEVQFKKPVMPGDTLFLEVEMRRGSKREFAGKGVVSVDGEVTAEAIITGTIMKKELLEKMLKRAREARP